MTLDPSSKSLEDTLTSLSNVKHDTVIVPCLYCLANPQPGFTFWWRPKPCDKERQSMDNLRVHARRATNRGHMLGECSLCYLVGIVSTVKGPPRCAYHQARLHTWAAQHYILGDVCMAVEWLNPLHRLARSCKFRSPVLLEPKIYYFFYWHLHRILTHGLYRFFTHNKRGRHEPQDELLESGLLTLLS